MTTQVYSSHHQTRQQLDDLDALLQRMLALPTNGVESGSGFSEAVNADSFAPLPPTLPQARSNSPSTNSESIVQAWRLATPVQPAAEPPMAIAVETAPPASFAPAPAPYPYSLVFGQPLPTEAPPPPVENYDSPPTVLTPPVWAIPVANTAAGLSYFSLPFVFVNRLFDLGTYLLGPLGNVFRNRPGRNLLGWLGVMMFLTAIGWTIAGWYGKGWSH